MQATFEQPSGNANAAHKRQNGAERLSQLFTQNFDMNNVVEEPNLAELPLSEDIAFEYINLDLDRLNKIKKTSFWTQLLGALHPHSRFGEVLTIDQLVSFYPKYEEPLFPLKTRLHFFAEKIYNWLLRLVGEAEPPCKRPEQKFRKLVMLALEEDASLRDELFLTLIKLQRNNPRRETVERVWVLLAGACGTLLPSPAFLPALYNYLVSVIDNHPDERVREWAKYSLKRQANQTVLLGQEPLPPQLRPESEGDAEHEGEVIRRGRRSRCRCTCRTARPTCCTWRATTRRKRC